MILWYWLPLAFVAGAFAGGAGVFAWWMRVEGDKPQLMVRADATLDDFRIVEDED